MTVEDAARMTQLAERLAAVRHRIEAAAQGFQVRVLDFERVSREHRQRLASELEQQARELGELASRFRPG